ncbi:hypothetical protein FQR65_LT14255 [Abscondita terminalis]|nr:hypothetical protein FQR65_LT14255 [Abscondita terminalis]
MVNWVLLNVEDFEYIRKDIVCHKCHSEEPPSPVIKKEKITENEESQSLPPPNNDEIFMEKIKEEFIVDGIKTEEFDTDVPPCIDESTAKVVYKTEGHTLTPSSVQVLDIAGKQIQNIDDSDICFGRASLNGQNTRSYKIQKRQKTKNSTIEKMSKYYKLKKKYCLKKLELAKFELEAKKELYAYEVKVQRLNFEIKKRLELINKIKENV